MKRLLFLFLSAALLSVSCDDKAETDIIPPDQKFKNDITGQWIRINNLINGVPEQLKIGMLMVYNSDMTGASYVLKDLSKDEFYPNYTFDYTVSQSGEVVLDEDYDGYPLRTVQQIVDLNEQFLVVEWYFGNDKHLTTFQRYYDKIVVVRRR